MADCAWNAAATVGSQLEGGRGGLPSRQAEILCTIAAITPGAVLLLAPHQNRMKDNLRHIALPWEHCITCVQSSTGALHFLGHSAEVPRSLSSSLEAVGRA